MNEPPLGKPSNEYGVLQKFAVPFMALVSAVLQLLIVFGVPLTVQQVTGVTVTVQALLAVIAVVIPMYVAYQKVYSQKSRDRLVSEVARETFRSRKYGGSRIDVERKFGLHQDSADRQQANPGELQVEVRPPDDPERGDPDNRPG